MSRCFLGRFSQRTRGVDSLKDVGLKLVVEVVCLAMSADLELVGDELAPLRVTLNTLVTSQSFRIHSGVNWLSIFSAR